MIKWIFVAIGGIIILVSNSFMWELTGIFTIIITMSLGKALSKREARRLIKR